MTGTSSRSTSAAAGDTLFVTGWSGKVERLSYHEHDAISIEGIAATRDEVLIRFSSPFGDRAFVVEAAGGLANAHWAPQPGVTITTLATGQRLARFPGALHASQQYYRIAVHLLPE